jgi:threonine dehydrogenase-like Zn-dependent dehydrogenase
MGAERCLDPRDGSTDSELEALLQPDKPHGGADLVFELSGRPEALDAALSVTGFDGRVGVGSWYGTRAAPLRLGGVFHRRRIAMISSQVSTLAPALGGRWDKGRRMATALDLVGRLRPGRLISHRFDVQAAPEAYRLLQDDPGAALQVVLRYAA